MTLSGTLWCLTGTGEAGQPVAIYQRQGGRGSSGSTSSGAYTFAGTVTTQADGSYRLSSPPLYTNTVFQARIGRRHARAIVRVAPVVTLTISSTPESPAPPAGAHGSSPARTRVTFTGTISPAVAGARVRLQVARAASGGRWRVIAVGRSAADGSYSVAHEFRIPGEMSIRAVVHDGGPNVAGVSQPISYEASQRQNPQLTIVASADPVSYGQTVTISGVAAGMAGQPVTLLARASGSAFTAVATSTTDENGGYTFTQTPLQNTVYRVEDAAARSTTLPEIVAFTLASALAPSTAQVGQQTLFSGTLTGAPAGQVVYLERAHASGVGFHVVAAATVDAASEYQISYTFQRAGTDVMRVNAPGDGQRRGTAGATFTVMVGG